MQDAEVATKTLLGLATEERRYATLSRHTVFVMGAIAERYRGDADRLLGRMKTLLGVLDAKEWDQLSGSMDRRRNEALARVSSARPTPTANVSPAPDGQTQLHEPPRAGNAHATEIQDAAGGTALPPTESW